MEAIAAFSLACNILQVLDFAYGVLKCGLYLAQPDENSLPEHSSASALATDLRGLTAKLQVNSSPSEADAKLKDLCTRCDAVAQELITILESLKATKKRQVVGKAIRSQFEKKRVTTLGQRLDSYRGEIQLYITTDLRSRIDNQTAQQLDSFKALTLETQNYTLGLLAAVEDAVGEVTGHIDRQTAIIQNLHQESKDTAREEAEVLRQQLTVDLAQERLQIITNVQNDLNKAAEAMGQQVSESTTSLLNANSVLQEVVTETITMNQETVQEDVRGLKESLNTIQLQLARVEAYLHEVVTERNNTRGNTTRSKELERLGNRLMNLLLSLGALYRELQKQLRSLLDQARAYFGEMKFNELFGNRGPVEAEIVVLNESSPKPRARSRWSIGGISRVQGFGAAFSDPSFHLVKIRVGMMHPIKTGRGIKQGGHHRSQSAIPMSNIKSQTNARYESINTDILTLYYRTCYLPFLPPPGRLLSIRRWKHREHRLPNPLEEYMKNIRRAHIVLGEEAAATELGRRGSEFVWYMALILAAVQQCVDWQRGTRIIRIAFSIVADWVDRLKSTAQGEAEYAVGAAEVKAVGDGILKLCQEQHDDMVPVWAGRFDQKTPRGERLGEDIVLWRRVAEASGLMGEVRDANNTKFGRHKADSDLQSEGLYENVGIVDSDQRRLQDAQIAFLLVYLLMISRANMVARIEDTPGVVSGQKHAAFPITRIPGTIKWFFDVPRHSAAFVVGRLLYDFGVAGLEFEEQTSTSLAGSDLNETGGEEATRKMETNYRDVVIKTLDLTTRPHSPYVPSSDSLKAETIGREENMEEVDI